MTGEQTAEFKAFSLCDKDGDRTNKGIGNHNEVSWVESHISRVIEHD